MTLKQEYDRWIYVTHGKMTFEQYKKIVKQAKKDIKPIIDGLSNKERNK